MSEQNDIDVTDQVEFGLNDADSLPLTKCVCGAEFGHWNFVIEDQEGEICTCPHCGRKLYFRCTIRVFEGKP